MPTVRCCALLRKLTVRLRLPLAWGLSVAVGGLIGLRHSAVPRGWISVGLHRPCRRQVNVGWAQGPRIPMQEGGAGWDPRCPQSQPLEMLMAMNTGQP